MSTAQQTLRIGRPIWIPPVGRPRYPTFSGRRETTVAIVGAGITGALVAHAFASAGVAATVLDAGLVGRGSTAASSALLLPEPGLELTQLEQRYGRRAGRRIWRPSHESVEQLVALLARLRIRCGLKSRDVVYHATTADAVERLNREFAHENAAQSSGGR